MPLGFAKSIFSRSAAAGAAAQGYWRGQGGADSAANYAYYTVDISNAADSVNDYSFVFWFRALASDWATGDNGIFYQIRNSTTRDVEVYSQYQDDGGGDINDHSINNFMRLGGGSRQNSTFTSGDDYFTSGTFASSVADGEWHCLMINGSNTASKRRIYLDNVDVQKDAQTDRVDQIGFGGASGQLNAGFSGAFPGAGAVFDYGPCWLYDSEIDFSSSTNRGYYYNAGNTDGYVDGGTDGTAGGAAQPEFYLYNTGSGLVNGGSVSGSISTTSGGSGTITDYDSTNGPGSGNVRT